MESERKRITSEPGKISDLPPKEDSASPPNESDPKKTDLSIPIDVPLAIKELLNKVGQKIVQESKE
ncbi:MAG: hypothetical protein HY974_03900 [Candidatus Kerfeldbacteria bacterium]|nr:hypothetical protein [Candidatus Kerfeldbacteria bacterium]